MKPSNIITGIKSQYPSHDEVEEIEEPQEEE